MKFARTVTGDISLDLLGHCQCHEHLFIAKGQSFKVNEALWMDDEELSLQEALLYRKAGGQTLVDAQPVGAGSMPDALRRIAKNSEIYIVASTGFHKRLFYVPEHWVFTQSEDRLADYFTSDLMEGLAVDADCGRPCERSDAKAGIIKCAIDEYGFKNGCEKLFCAAAIAQQRTGAPMLIHTEDGLKALELIGFLLDKGVKAQKIIICHAERSMERMHEKLEIAKTGVYFQCDTIARFKYHSDEEEACFLRRLCEDGYEDRILLGLDTTRQRLKSYGGQTGLDYILVHFLPLLLKSGITQIQIDKMCMGSPAAALAFSLN